MFLLVVTWAGPNTETPSHGAASSFLHDGCRVMFRMVVRGTSVVLTLELFALAFEVIFQFLGLLRYQSDSTHQRCRAATSDDRCHKGVAAAQQSQHRKQQSRKGGFHLAIHSQQGGRWDRTVAFIVERATRVVRSLQNKRRQGQRAWRERGDVSKEPTSRIGVFLLEGAPELCRLRIFRI